jgi:hypothetical protein
MTNEQAAADRLRMLKSGASWEDVYTGEHQAAWNLWTSDKSRVISAYLAEHPPVPADTAKDTRQAAERAAEKWCFDTDLADAIESEFAPLLAAKDAEIENLKYTEAKLRAGLVVANRTNERRGAERDKQAVELREMRRLLAVFVKWHGHGGVIPERETKEAKELAIAALARLEQGEAE